MPSMTQLSASHQREWDLKDPKKIMSSIRAQWKLQCSMRTIETLETEMDMRKASRSKPHHVREILATGLKTKSSPIEHSA